MEPEATPLLREQRIENIDFQVEPWVDRRIATRISNGLQRAGVFTVEDLVAHTRRELEAIPGIGIICTVVIEKKLKQMKLKLRENRS